MSFFRTNNRPNPFEKFLGPEDHLHHQVIRLLQVQYPKIKFHHSPLEGKRSPFEQFKLKYLGTDSGFPDLIIPVWKLAIELKSKNGKLSVNQETWLDYFDSIGWDTIVANNFADVERYLSMFLKVKKIS